MAKRRRRTNRKKLQRQRRRAACFVMVAVLLVGLLAAASLVQVLSQRGLLDLPGLSPWRKHLTAGTRPEVSIAWEFNPTDLDAVPEGVDVLCPTWLYVVADEANGQPLMGDLRSQGYGSVDYSRYITAVHEAGAEVWVTLSCFDSDLAKVIMTDAAVQEAFVADLKAWVEQWGVDGLCLDFEKMDPADKARYTAFAAACRRALGERALICAVTVPTLTEQPNNWYQCYDRAALAEVCDYLAVMSYDAHYDGDFTHTADVNWVKRHMRKLLETVPSHKLLMGIPFYGVEYAYAPDEDPEKIDWQGNPKRSTFNPETLWAYLESGQAVRGDDTVVVDTWLERGRFDRQKGAHEYTFTAQDGYRHTLYLEGSESLAQKLRLAEEHCLAGVCVWKKMEGTEPLFEGLSQAAHQKED